MLYTLPRVQLFCLHQVYFAIGLIIYVKLSHLLGLFFIEVKYNVIRRIKAKLTQIIEFLRRSFRLCSSWYREVDEMTSGIIECSLQRENKAS